MEFHKIAQGDGHVRGQFCAGFDPGFEMEGFQPQGAGLAVQFRVKAADQPVLMQNWQQVIAIPALWLRHVKFNQMLETPEHLVTLLRPPEVIPGVEKSGPLGAEFPAGGLLEERQVFPVDNQSLWPGKCLAGDFDQGTVLN